MSVPTRQVRGCYSADTITVYQAYSAQIALPAVAANRFVPPFKRDRMTWIKPSFLWMMYRSGWATKPGQERVLSIDITREGFEWALARACLSHYDRDLHGDKATWSRQLKTSPVRVQWDPERSLHLTALPYRSLQVGLSGEAVDRYVDDWTVTVTDITPTVHRVRDLLRSGDDQQAAAHLPVERAYPGPDRRQRQRQPGRHRGTASMIRFRFELYPLDEVSPWGGDRPTLHWFGLTEGWYWLEAGGQELLRRTRQTHPHPFVDYYLARLWEDVNLLTPTVLEPVPDDVQPFIDSHPAQWACDPLEFVAEPDGYRTDGGDADAPGHPVLTAAIWYGEHNLDLGYLRNPPRLRFWRTTRGVRDEITVDWQHQDDGEIGFTADHAVRLSVPTSAYREAVHTLHRDLMNMMGQRIEELERRGGLPGVDLDLVQLRREHEDRQHWLARNLGRSPATDWDAVRRGARQLLVDGERADAAAS